MHVDRVSDRVRSGACLLPGANAACPPPFLEQALEEEKIRTRELIERESARLNKVLDDFQARQEYVQMRVETVVKAGSRCAMRCLGVRPES
eukprot:6210579-Pleurochrysis_carterae.AAC.1